MNENTAISGREPISQWLVSSEAIGAISRVVSSMSLIVVTVGFAVSLFYNWGFFFALGMAPDTAPASIQDYVATWMTWFPGTISVSFCFLVLELFESRKSRDSDKKETPDRLCGKHERTTKDHRILRIVSIAGICVLLLSLFLGGATSQICLWTGATLMWMAYVLWCRNGSGSKSRAWILGSNLIILIPPFALAAFLYGFSQAHPGSYGQNAIFLVYKKGEEKPLEVEIVRTLENWMLIRSKTGQLGWIPVNSIDRFDLKKRRFLSFGE